MPAPNANPLVSIGFVAAAVTFPIVKICRGFVAAWTWVDFWQHGFGVTSGRLLVVDSWARLGVAMRVAALLSTAVY